MEGGAEVILCGDAFDARLAPLILPRAPFRLVICDPPYGDIVDEAWDVAQYERWFDLCAWWSAPDATVCMWGGIGKRGNRPFLKWLSSFDESGDWRIADVITWKKRRAYGKPRDYLFTREECAVIVRGNPVFNVPYLDEKRGYPGYNAKYPAKSAYLRRSNVWTDITEVLRGKIHKCQKPDALYRVLIETHSSPGGDVFDPCAGSLTTVRAARACGRGVVCIERSQEYIDKGVA